MGLGPSIKMTSLHHYDCPVTRSLLNDEDVDFAGVIVDGVSENFDAKVATAVETGKKAESLQWDGAVVAIDGWGNHHVDFVNVIEQLGIRDIPAVGMSYIGLQGRLVATNQFVETVVDFNKESSGYESCVVGQNNLNDMDAYKAVGILKNKIRKYGRSHACGAGSGNDQGEGILKEALTRKYYRIDGCRIGEKTSIADDKDGCRILTLRSGMEKELLKYAPEIRDVHLRIIGSDDDRDFFVNSNLDFMPIACKASESSCLGKGDTLELEGLKVMLNGVEEKSGFQPANIGSSEGLLSEQVKFDQAGTPASSDAILQIDFLFREGEGRTACGICAAHQLADRLLNEIRNEMRRNLGGLPADKIERFQWISHPGKMRIGLVKICSGLGNMYDTALMPKEPAGYEGAYLIRNKNNDPVLLTPTQVLDGAIHSLI